MATEINIMAIDPGLSGAVAFYFPTHPELITAEDLPVAGHEIDVAALRRRIDQFRPTVAIVEEVAARPGQGVVSMFRFGQAFGTILLVLTNFGEFSELDDFPELLDDALAAASVPNPLPAQRRARS